MKKGYVIVSYPIYVDVEVDETKLDDDDYVESIQEEACEKAKEFLFDTDPVVTNSDIPELIE